MLKDIERSDSFLIQKVYKIVREDVIDRATDQKVGERDVEFVIGYQLVPIRDGNLIHNTSMIIRCTTLNGARSIASGEPPKMKTKRTLADSQKRKALKRQEDKELREKMQSGGR